MISPSNVLSSDMLIGSNKAINFSELINSKLKEYKPGTRIWLLRELEDFCSDKNDNQTARLMWIMGGAGTGKSVVAAVFVNQASLHTNQYKIGAIHFCLHTNPKDSDPIRLITSLAVQLAEQLPECYKGVEISTDILTSGISNAFESLIKNPLLKAKQENPLVILIDALDELPSTAIRPLLKLISQELLQLPGFIRLVVTSREEQIIKDIFKGYNPRELRVDERRNKQDICDYLAGVASEVSVIIVLYY